MKLVPQSFYYNLVPDVKDFRKWFVRLYGMCNRDFLQEVKPGRLIGTGRLTSTLLWCTVKVLSQDSWVSPPTLLSPEWALYTLCSLKKFWPGRLIETGRLLFKISSDFVMYSKSPEPRALSEPSHLIEHWVLPPY